MLDAKILAQQRETPRLASLERPLNGGTSGSRSTSSQGGGSRGGGNSSGALLCGALLCGALLCGSRGFGALPCGVLFSGTLLCVVLLCGALLCVALYYDSRSFGVPLCFVCSAPLSETTFYCRALLGGAPLCCGELPSCSTLLGSVLLGVTQDVGGALLDGDFLLRNLLGNSAGTHRRQRRAPALFDAAVHSVSSAWRPTPGTLALTRHFQTRLHMRQHLRSAVHMLPW